MKSSFIKSLPSHRRKEKERKQRQQRQRRSHGGTSYEGGDFGRLAGGANPSDSNPVPDGIHSNKIAAEKIKPLTTFSSSARLESEYKSTMNDLSFKNYDEKGVYTQNESPAKKLRTNATCHSNIDDHDREHNDFVSSPVSQTLLEDKAPTESESNHKAEMPRTKPNDFFSPGLPEGSSGMIIDRNQLISNNCNGKGQTNSLSLIVCAGAHCQPKSKYGTSDEVGNDLNDDDDSVVEGTELLTSCLPISGGAFTQDKYHSLISNRRRHNSLKGDTAIDHETQFVTIKQFVSSLAQDRIHSTSYGPVGTISAPNLTREKVTNNSVVQSSIKSEEDEESAATNNENTKPQTFRTPWTSKHRSKDSTVMSKNQEVDLLNLQFIPPINRDGIVMDNAATDESRHTIIRAGFNDNDKASERTTQDSSTTFRCASKTSSQKELTEFILSSTDLADIIEAVKETIAMGKSEESDDFIDTDLENLLSSLESFHNYLLDISIPSTEEARDLETKSDGNDKVFAIFRYGLNMDHCNVIFYLDAMKDVCNRMIQVGVHSQTNNKHISKTRKLDRFSSLVRWIFGVDIVDDSKRISSFTVNVTKEAGNQTSLLFQAKPLETRNISSGEKGINLPEHLVVISRLFDDFAAQRRQKIQYQLDMTMQDLSSIRMGAFELQRLAVQLRDQIAEAKNEAQEAKAECGRLQDTIMRQKHEFQRREESFERLKEHYEAEIIKKEQEIARVNNQHEQRFKRTKEVESATLRLRKEETPSEIDANLKNINDGPRHSPSLSRNSLCEPLSVRRRGTETNEKISMLERHLPQPSPVTSAKDDEVQEREQCKGLHTATHPSTFSLRRDAASLPRTVEEKNHSDGAYEITSNRQAGKPCRDPLKQLSVNILSTRLHDSRKVQTEKKAKNSKTRPVHDANYNPPERGNAKEECAVIKEQVPQSNSDTNVSSDEYPTNTKRIIDNSNREFSNTTTPQETKHHSKTSEESNLGSYKYKEVVRGHDRRALPGRECEHCRLFHDAMCAQNCGDYFDREKIVNECSRHRSRYEQDLTPPDFWEMSFADSIANRKRSDENISPVSD